MDNQATRSSGREGGAKVRPPMSRHTRLVHRIDRIAKLIIWIAASATLTALVLIIGYIFVNGFYTRSVDELSVTSSAEESVTIGQAENGSELSVVANRSLRLRRIEYDTLRELLDGATGNWGFITSQDRRVAVIVFDDGTSNFSEEVARHFLGASDAPFGPSVTVVRTLDEVETRVRENGGAIALVPPRIAEEVDRVRTIPIRETSVAVHPSVTELTEGRRIRSLEEEELQRVLDGEVTNWWELRAPDPAESAPRIADDPITVVAFPERARNADDVVVKTIEEFAKTIRETPGAIGVTRRHLTERFDLAVMPIEVVTHSANLRPSFFYESPSRAGEVGGINTIILNTLVMIIFVLMIATPIGVAAAVYLVEYAKQGRLLMILRVGTDTLAGVPSIIFGLFGLVFFAQFLGLQTGLLAGSFTITLMILPTLVRTSEEALRSVPDAVREGSMALGATKIQTLFRVVLPSAAPGILTGVVLGIGRAIGETAAVLFTMGSNLALLRNLNSPMRVLSVHLYMLVRETISIPNAFATATILVLIVLLVNIATRRLIGRGNAEATS